MTRAELRKICDSLNDTSGHGGKARLAELVDWDYSTLWRKLNDESRITRSDELAVLSAVRSQKKPINRKEDP